MLLRFASLMVVTGLAFIVMAWIDPAGPLLIVVGALIGALDAERRLDVRTPRQVRSTQIAADAIEDRRAA